MRALVELPSHVRRRLIAAFEGGLLDERSPASAFESLLGPAADVASVVAAVNALAQRGVGGAGVAVLLQALDTARMGMTRPDLVWTGPAATGLHVRETRRVYDELIDGASQSIWVSTYAFFDGPRAFARLARRMDALPALQVMLLLNVQRPRNDSSSADAIVRRFTDRFWKVEWPGDRRPEVFFDPRSLETDGPGAVLHAKSVIVDDESLFVTSANLTEAALDRNVELGLVIRDRALALAAKCQLRVLIEGGWLQRLPTE